MDKTIKEIYEFSVKAQEREVDIIKNRLEFINWLFGVASALLFSSVLAARTITPDPYPEIAPENYIALSAGLFSFLAIICIFIGKWQGYNSIRARITILTLLDVQKCAFLKDNPPRHNTADKAVKFSMFEYLPAAQKEKYDNRISYCQRNISEILWLILTSTAVFISLASMLVLLAELTI